MYRFTTTVVLIAVTFTSFVYALDSITKKAMGSVYPSYPAVEYGQGVVAEYVKRGEYLAKAGNCIACHSHTEAGIPAFAGGPPIQTPFGTFYGGNITPDPETGIGQWSEADFIKAMREGVSPEGEHYFPVFPYLYFAQLTDDDLRAIWVYLQKIPAVRQANRKHDVPFPFNWRRLQLGWKLLYFMPYQAALGYDVEQSVPWNRGRYLVEGLGHCAMCHTPINLLGGLKRQYHLTGHFIENYWAPNITALALERSSVEEVADIFKYGRLSLGAGVVAGPMAEVNHNSLSQLSQADQIAIATYLKSVHSEQPFDPKMPWISSTHAQGKAVYEAACANCHIGGESGAPRIGDRGNWSYRAARRDLETLYLNTLNGFNSMPTKGGCVTCSDAEIKAAVDYVLYESLDHQSLKKLKGESVAKPKKSRSGIVIYQTYCSTCHDQGRLGAAKLTDTAYWKRQVAAKNVDGLVSSTLKGSYRMPKKGGCQDCRTEEIIEAVKYILSESIPDKDYSQW